MSSSFGLDTTSADSACAAAPFDHEKADIILRSSDNVDFRVFKLFLSLASSFFETLFNVPQPAEADQDQEIKDGLVVVPVTEDSKTLDALLRFCYPCTLADDPKMEMLRDAMDVLEAARKYSLDAIEVKARQAFSNPKILEVEPLRCFAIAHRGQLREETLLAARYTLTQPLVPSWFQEIELLTATDLLSLLSYHKQCGEAVYALRSDLSWITSHYGSAEACSWLAGRCQSNYGSGMAFGSSVNYGSDRANNDCGCPRASDSSRPGFKLGFRDVAPFRWWEEFMEETFTALRDKPCKKTVQGIAVKTVESVKARKCQSCSPKVTEGMRDFVDLFARKMDEVVSQIELELRF